jgi:hypothetical protein
MPSVPGALGVPVAPVGSATREGVRGAFRCWQRKRQRKRADLLESKANARENLRDFNKFTSQPWGGSGG